MIDIGLERLHTDGFRSFAVPQEVAFPTAPGLRFLAGRNKAEPRLEANGAGKSSLWEAIAWCLTGWTSNGDRASEVVSWGKDRPEVLVRITRAGHPHTIRRQGLPDRLYLDDKPIEQAELESFLGLSRKRLLQAVFFGQSAPLFLDLNAADRIALLDEVLDLGLWLDLSEQAHDAEAAILREVAGMEQEIARNEGALESLPDEESLQERADNWRRDHQEHIDQAIEGVAQAEHRVAVASRRLARTRITEPKVSGAEATRNLADLRLQANDIQHEMAAIHKELKRLQETLDFYEGHSECPTCGQAITRTFVEKQYAEVIKQRKPLEARLLEAEADDKELALKRAKAHEAINTISVSEMRYRSALGEGERALSAEKRELDMLVQQVEDLGAEKHNPYADQIAEARTKRRELKRALGRLTLAMNEKKGRAQAYGYWKQGFKKVRLFLVKRILASLEIEIASAAISLGLIGWRVRLQTEVETKKGTLRSGITVAVKSPASPDVWKAWSGGENQRIKLAVNLGLSNLIQRMAGVRFLWEVWDEPSQHLSGAGIEDLLGALHDRAKAQSRCIWIVDHHALTYSDFDAVWTVVKDAKGSRVVTKGAT